MDATARLTAIEDIRNLKARYCRAVDRKELDLLRSLFARDAVADYSRAGGPDRPRAASSPFAEPLRGADKIAETIIGGVANMVTVHHCATGEIVIDTLESGRATWPMVDRLLLPPGGETKEIVGYGFYLETYVREDGAWKIRTVTLERTRVDVIPA